MKTNKRKHILLVLLIVLSIISLLGILFVMYFGDIRSLDDKRALIKYSKISRDDNKISITPDFERQGDEIIDLNKYLEFKRGKVEKIVNENGEEFTLTDSFNLKEMKNQKLDLKFKPWIQFLKTVEVNFNYTNGLFLRDHNNKTVAIIPIDKQLDLLNPDTWSFSNLAGYIFYEDKDFKKPILETNNFNFKKNNLENAYIRKIVDKQNSSDLSFVVKYIYEDGSVIPKSKLKGLKIDNFLTATKDGFLGYGKKGQVIPVLLPSVDLYKPKSGIERSFILDNDKKEITIVYVRNDGKAVVSFNTDGGSPKVKSQVVVKGGYLKEPTEILKKPNSQTARYEFKYWYHTDKSVKFDFKNTPITSKIVLTALYEEITETTYDVI